MLKCGFRLNLGAAIAATVFGCSNGHSTVVYVDAGNPMAGSQAQGGNSGGAPTAGGSGRNATGMAGAGGRGAGGAGAGRGGAGGVTGAAARGAAGTPAGGGTAGMAAGGGDPFACPPGCEGGFCLFGVCLAMPTGMGGMGGMGGGGMGGMNARGCGNGMIGRGETCDPPSSCPTSCDDGNACTVDAMSGSPNMCNVACMHTMITACANGDGCCPSGCNPGTDNDCSSTCGNGTVELGETCDPVSSCPTSCDDSNSCTTDSMVGAAANCNVTCMHNAISACTDHDSCCPAGCNNNTDSDCSVSCGNGAKETGETCDPPSSCPASCDDSNACTADVKTGSADTCNVACTHTAITTCASGDGCCPAGCNKNIDSDCSATCGNGAIEAGETCDPSSTCPTGCDDSNSCTTDVKTGSADTCNVACTHTPITACTAGDSCCPNGCGPTTDGDCAGCGNGKVEGNLGETCDPPSSCPASCDDGNACTADSSSGSANACTLACSHTPITACANNDGCCPSGCGPTTDNDCAGCGNGKVEGNLGETCDPPSACVCAPMNCMTLTRSGAPDTCNVTCDYVAITQCSGNTGDGCCPSGCNSSTDADCP